jgi:hypothetical protein
VGLAYQTLERAMTDMPAVVLAGESNPKPEPPPALTDFLRISLAENWRRRGKFEDVKFIFPNAPSIPITIV